MTAALDSSAVLAWLRDEPGADVVHPLLPVSIMSVANWSETWQKLHQHGADAGRAASRLRTLGVRVEPLTEANAVTAASLWMRTRAAGLSLPDRCSRHRAYPRISSNPKEYVELLIARWRSGGHRR